MRQRRQAGALKRGGVVSVLKYRLRDRAWTLLPQTWRASGLRPWRRPLFGRAIKEMEATRERLAEAKRLQLNARARGDTRAQHQHSKEVKRLMTELLRRERAAGMFS